MEGAARALLLSVKRERNERTQRERKSFLLYLSLLSSRISLVSPLRQSDLSSVLADGWTAELKYSTHARGDESEFSVSSSEFANRIAVWSVNHFWTSEILLVVNAIFICTVKIVLYSSVFLRFTLFHAEVGEKFAYRLVSTRVLSNCFETFRLVQNKTFQLTSYFVILGYRHNMP